MGSQFLFGERPNKLSDPAHEGVRLQPGRDGRVRCSAWLGGLGVNMALGKRYKGLTLGVTLEEAQRNDMGIHARVRQKKVARCDDYKT